MHTRLGLRSKQRLIVERISPDPTVLCEMPGCGKYRIAAEFDLRRIEPRVNDLRVAVARKRRPAIK